MKLFAGVGCGRVRFRFADLHRARSAPWHRHGAGRGESGRSRASEKYGGNAERVFEHIGRRGGSGVGGARGLPGCSGFKARAVADALAQMCGEKMEPPVRASVEIVEFEGSPVVVATVPELPPELKPCFVKSRAMHDGSYARVGDGDRRLSPYEAPPAGGASAAALRSRSGRRGCDGRL